MRPPTILAPNGRPARLEIRNQYQAATTSPYRSTIPGTLQDANKDLPRATRRELARQAWHWYENSPLITGIIERLVTYAVGTGIIPVPSSSDKAWNTACAEYWDTVAASIEYRQGLPWHTYVATVFRGMLVGGDVLTTYQAGQPSKVLTYESHDITTLNQTGTTSYTDGLTLDATGRVIGYELTGGVKVSAENATHHWLSLRPKQYRGVTVLASALMNIHDISDILALEKQAVKDASAKTDIITTATGEFDDEALLRGTYTGTDSVVRSDYYRNVFGAEARVLKDGDTYTPYVPARPSQTWQGFMAYLSQTICLATGIPPSVVIPVDGNGVDVRRDLATAQRVVEVWQLTLSSQLLQVRNHIVGAAIASGELDGAPDDWASVEWQYPKAITVDSGRDMKADMELVKAGLMTRREFHGQYGQNAEEQEEQMISEAVTRRDAITAAGLTIEELAKLLNPQQAAKTAQPQQAADSVQPSIPE